MIIRRVKLKELGNFVKSDEYLEYENKPISLLRANSYINNPYTQDDDVILYMAFKEKKLIGYKTILVDTFTTDNKKNSFGWLSGTWTHHNHRRKGVSLLLFDEVFKDWKRKLMYTNYAEESKAAYDKTGKFELLKSIEGYRHYLRFSFKELLAPKSVFFQQNGKILGCIDKFLNYILDFCFKSSKIKFSDFYELKEIENWDDEINTFLKPFKENELFQRDKVVFDWIKKYPWVKTDNQTKINSRQYFFSLYADKFDAKWYKIYDNKTKIILGIVLISIRNKHLKIPYIYASPKIMVKFKNNIINLCSKYKINYLTIYSDGLNKALVGQKKIKSKKFVQNYFATKDLFKEFPNIKNKDIQSGDGDVVFT